MQAIFETIFDVCYLVGVVAAGVIIVKKAGSNTLFKLLGIMAIVLGCGDAFHLVPRIFALWGDGTAAHPVSLGFGKAVTSVTMTIFYVILYYVWRRRYNIVGKNILTYSILGLAAIRVGLCLFPQNMWLSADAPLSWGIYRNIPFLILGVIIIVIFAQKVRETKDKEFKHIALAITLSFLFYIPVVLFADAIPAIGMLMIPKTLAYAWIVRMGYKVCMKKEA